MYWIAFAVAAEDPEQLVERAWSADTVRLAEEARLEAAALDRPTLSEPDFRPVFRDVGSRTETPSTRLRLRQGLEPIGSLRAERLAREAEVRADLAELELERLEVRREVLELWDQARVATVRKDLLAREAELQARRLGVARLRVEAGLKDADQAADALLERAEIQMRSAEATRTREEALAGLTSRVGEVDLPEELELVALESALRAELPVRPAPGAGWLDARVEAAQAELRAEKAARRTVVDWVQGDVTLEEGKQPAFGFGLSIPLPSARFFGGDVKRVAAEVSALQRAREAYRTASERDLAAAEARFSAAVAAVEASRASLDALAADLPAFHVALTPDDQLDVDARVLDLQRRHLDLIEDGFALRRDAEALRLAARSAVE